MPRLWRLAAFLLLTSLAALDGARAAPAPEQSQLYFRIETGEHEATINRMAVAPDGTTMFTAADDKTARAWSVDTLQAEGIMRPPIGPADDGALYAVAVSGRLIAVAGRIRDPGGDFAVQFFARPSLRPAGNIAHFSEPIRALRFSADGKLLAVGMQDRGGVRILDLESQTERMRDSAYGGAVTWMDFGPDGTLAVVADDGTLRLCGAGRSECTPYPLPGGARPWGVAFSPDGARIAVGDRQSPLVHIFDVAKARFGRDFKGAPQRQGALGVVAFSRDGQTLFAAGTYKDPAAVGGLAARLLRRWTLDGHALGETAVATDTVTDLAATASGVVFTTAEPAVGKLDDAGRLVALRRSRHVDFRNAGQTSFRVSYDGSLIEMPASAPGSAQVAGGRPGASVVFDVVGRRLVPTSAVAGPLASPLAGAAGVAVTEWLNNHAPRVNGQLVLLEPPELARAAAVVPDGSGVAIGTNFFVRYVGPGGERWKAVTNAPAWAVNVSGDGRLVVAGLGDGTIHWYRASDGRELLALFADPATGRWVLSTSEGYFDHDHRVDGGPDGRTMVGYQIAAAGSGANSFIEIGQLYPRFFRPDLVGLSFRDDAASRDEINDQHERLGSVPMIVARGLPPRFHLLDLCARGAEEPAESCASPPGASKPPGTTDALLTTSADAVRIRFRLDRAVGEVGGVTIRRDGAVIAPPVVVEAESAHSRTEIADIPLGSGANDVSFTPVSPGGDVEASERESTRIRVDRAPVQRGAPQADTAVAAAEGAAPLPRPVTLHVLSVGVNTYARPALLAILPNAANDGKAFADMMRQPTPPVSRAVNAPPPLLNAQATRANIIAAMKDIAAKAQPDDLVVIFLAGHGAVVDGRYYFAPYDLGTHDHDLYHAAAAAKDAAAHDKAFDQMFRKEGLSQDDILPLISSMKASRVAILLDTCYSASLATANAVIRRDENDTMTGALGHAVGRFVLSGAIAKASDDDQRATSNGDHPATDDAASEDDDDGNRDGTGNGHGLFSSFLLRALAGEADLGRTGRIDIYKLTKYTTAHVEDASGNTQHPRFYFGGNDFFDLRATPTK